MREHGIHLVPGRALHPAAKFEDLDLGERRFDKVFAVRVGLFHREPERARGIVERWLAPGGTVDAFFDEPGPPGRR